VSTPNILARKPEESPLPFCKIGAESEGNNWPGPLVRLKLRWIHGPFRSTRENYDADIGYADLKREASKCVVKGWICSEQWDKFFVKAQVKAHTENMT
jgi:hypothetical protein